METRPPALAEAIVGRLIPPACRESVLGDLNERYTTTPRYLFEAAGIVPRLVVSLARRSLRVDADLAWAEAGLLFIIVSAAPSSLHTPGGAVVAVAALCVSLATLLVCDGYADTNRGQPASVAAECVWEFGYAFRDVMLALTMAWLVEKFPRDSMSEQAAFLLIVLRATSRMLFVPRSGQQRLQPSARKTTVPAICAIAAGPLAMMYAGPGNLVGRVVAVGSFLAAASLAGRPKRFHVPALPPSMPFWEWLAVLPFAFELAYYRPASFVWASMFAISTLFGAMRAMRLRLVGSLQDA